MENCIPGVTFSLRTVSMIEGRSEPISPALQWKRISCPSFFCLKSTLCSGSTMTMVSATHILTPPPPVSSVKGHVVKVWDVKHEPSIPQRNTRRRWCPDERLWFIILNCLYNIQTFTIFLYNHIVLLRIGLNPKTTSLLYRISPWFTLHKNKVILVTIILSTNSIIYKSLEK